MTCITPLVGLPGLEPGKTGPESVVLPLHHSPISNRTTRSVFDDAKIQLFYHTPNFLISFFILLPKKTKTRQILHSFFH